jgi:hypothetical protein
MAKDARGAGEAAGSGVVRSREAAKLRAAAVAQAQAEADAACGLEKFAQAVSLYSKAIALDGGMYVCTVYMYVSVRI